MANAELRLGPSKKNVAGHFMLALGALALAACSSPASVSHFDGGGAGGAAGSGGSGIDAPVDTPAEAGGDSSGGHSGTTGNGLPCTGDADCQSGFCVAEAAGSVCCESACGDTCHTCTNTDNLGKCVIAKPGTDPKSECPDELLVSCGHTGTCDDKGACAFWPSGTICQAARCTGQTRTLSSTCDGAGSCKSNGTLSCGNYKCALGDQCLTSCTSDSDCTTGNLCINGSCGKKAAGSKCLNGAECADGYCQQGVCCTGPCTGTCMSCGLPGTEGQCKAVGPGFDPEDSCSAMAPSTCGNTGVCDGKGGCAKYPSGSACIDQICVGNTKTLVGQCNDVGACVPGTQVKCDPYKCGTAGDCLSSCTGDADCLAPNTCIGGLCAKKPNGNSCSMGNECASGVCSQGVCCNVDCSGICKSCALSGSIGSCTNVPKDQDPMDQCSDLGAASCGNDGTCNGSGACKRYASGTVCKASTCTGTTLKTSSQCDGNGICVNGSTGSCDPFQCDSTNGVCKETCTSDAECTTGNSCLNNSCGKKPLGAVCAGDVECASSFCAQGVCCKTSCTGNCMSCALATSPGICTQVPAGQAPNPPTQCSDQGSTLICGNNGKCDGAGSCQYYGNSTTCAPASCTGSTYTPARTCDGTGTCKAVTSSSCAPYLCNTATKSCKTTCGNDADCVSPNVCQGGVCRKKQLGDACGGGTECQSGFCSQGYCCDSNCTATCKSCAVAGALGTCSFVPNNTDPLNQCADDGVDTCGRDGMCDGAGLCRQYASGTVCKAKSCVGSTYTPARTCNGSGVCGTVSTSQCDPYGCDTTNSVCYTSCTAATQCVSPNVCIGTSCGKKADGQSCTAAGECTSNFCAQGVCCHTACSGTCQSCSLTGSVGTCTLVPSGTAPFDASQCPAQLKTTCGTDGTCDGAGACKKWPAGSICQASTCSGSTLTTAKLCDGLGVCQPPTTQSCGAFQCNTASGVCKTSCTGDADCVSPNTCNAGSCGPKPPGASCAAGTECKSGYCSQGVCCDIDCTGTCKSCAVVGKEGTCSNVPSGIAPTPATQCTNQGTSTCGTDGTCDGAGACHKYASGTVCFAATCSASTFTPARTCNGTGTCQTASATACDPYACNGTTACKTTCTTTADCSGTNVCNTATGQCGKANGSTCSTPAECSTGNCVDGVCCASTCTGACRSCAVAGSLGTCTLYAAGADPDNECPTDVASGCQRDGACDGAGACRLYSSSTVCIAASCNGSTLTTTRLCDGAGSCKSGSNVACDPYACGSGACKNTCTVNTDCSGTNVCNTANGQCGKANGVACTLGGECASGVCAQNVCCSTACSGTCKSCALSGTAGTCTNVPTGQDPLSQCNDAGSTTCGDDGFCDGAGACRHYAASTVCAAASCTDAQTLSPARNCAGTGAACPAATSTPCAPYACSAGACKTSCTVAADCAANYSCASNVCKKNNGQACTAASDCASNNCVDGYCCNSACATACMACDVAGALGTCTNVPVNTDPHADCAAAACNATTGVYTPKINCTGAGACAAAAPQTCAANFSCTTSGCKSTCSVDGDCANGYKCASGSCKKPNGQTCSLASDCATGNCVDGYCCNTSCATGCMACDVAGSLGTCANVPASTDPHADCAVAACNASTGVYTPKVTCTGSGACAAAAPQTCANNYSCTTSGCKSTCTVDGDCANGMKCASGSCKKPNGTACSVASDCASNACADNVCCDTACTGTCKACNLGGSVGTCTNIAGGTDPINECTAASCNTATATFTAKANCNGAGACTTPSGSVCGGNYNCTTAGCKATCTADTDCATNYKCTGGACKKANGQTCTAATDCFSGACADGYCCNSACSGACRSCAVAGSLGTCTNFATGQDPENECTDNGTAGCGTNGVCDGAGACQLYPATQQCVAAGCSDPTHQVVARNCDGSGTCTAATPVACNVGYACVSGTCKTSCTAAGDCSSGYICSGNVCIGSGLADGSVCSTGAQCLSTNCVDGYCCNSACSGLCQACNVANKLGACTSIPAGTDPGNECGDNGSAACGTNGMCDGAGACQLYASGTTCGPAACADSTHLTPASTCNGSGTCLAAGAAVACNAGYSCVAGACKTSCTSGADCASGYVCAGSSCVLGRANGAVCAAGAECLSANCVDGVCCDSACTGACKSCAVAGSEGTCTNHGVGTDPDNECSDNGASLCGTDGMCNGAGACELYSSSTPCAAVTCSDSTHSMAARNCSGAGVCAAGTITACNLGYACVAGACKTSCTANSDCASGYTCNGSTCVGGTFKVFYKCSDPGNPGDQMMKPNFQIHNTGTTPVALSTLRLRYWYTKEPNTASGTSAQWYWSTNQQYPTLTEVTVAKTNADRYVELAWSTAAGNIAANGFWELQWGIYKLDWTNFTEAVAPAAGADWSYDPTKTSYTAWDRITLYQTPDAGVTWNLVWGIEPS